MSYWSHVSGCIRLNHIKEFRKLTNEDFEHFFGKIITFDDLENDNGFDTHIAMGSEGSLGWTVVENPDDNCMAAFDILVTGDLRDVESSTPVIEWLKKVVELLDTEMPNVVNPSIRDLVIKMYVGFTNEEIVITLDVNNELVITKIPVIAERFL